MTWAILWTVPTAMLGGAAILLFGRVDIPPTGVNSPFVEYSVALLALLMMIATLIVGWLMLRAVLLAIWPSRVGIDATAEDLTLRLGPYGTRRYPANELEVRYPFELLEAGEIDEGTFEAYLPEERQRAEVLPRIVHRRADEPISRTILNFTNISEKEVAGLLRPYINAWRAAGPREVSPRP